MQFNHFDKAFSSTQVQPNVSESDAKDFRKKLRNRQSAQRARDRQKARMRWLERQVEILNVKNQQLQNENNILKSYMGNGVYASYFRTANCESTEKSDNGKLLNPRPLYSPSSDRTQNREGRLHVKMKIIKSEGDNFIRDTDKVAVISPIACNNGPTHFEWPPPKHIQEQVGTHIDPSLKVRERHLPSPTTLPGKISKGKILEDPPRGLAQQSFDPILAMQLMCGKYPGLLPYFMCPAIYDTGLTLASISQHPSLLGGMRVGIYPENGANPVNESESRGVCDLARKGVLESWNTSIYANASPYLNTTRKRSRKVDADDQTKNEMMKFSEKRLKTNSFESECSSPMSSETDSSTHTT